MNEEPINWDALSPEEAYAKWQEVRAMKRGPEKHAAIASYPEPERTTKRVHARLIVTFHGDCVAADEIEDRLNA